MGDMTTPKRAAPIPDESGSKMGSTDSRLVEKLTHDSEETVTMSRSSTPC